MLAEYSRKLDDCTLCIAYQDLPGDPPQDIPFLVWLLENPDSPCSLPGNISLKNHDRLHCILNQGFSSENEAYVVGFSMGNDVRANWIHLITIKIAAFLFYPKKYRFKYVDMKAFDRGVQLGRSTEIKNLNQGIPPEWECKTLREIRRDLNLEI